ncbi:MAG: ASCH domain-containing protein [Armatimonadetes bacterium]|nr:ASCH domain-containing protein [Armatimonadota bacterium]
MDGRRVTVGEFWQEYADSVVAGQSPDGYVVFKPEQDEEDIAALIVTGWKVAKCSLLWWLEALGQQPPEPGLHEIIVAGDGEPVAVIVTDRVATVPFEAVDEEHARKEGEGHLTLADWQERNWWRFNRQCKEIGREAVRDMPVVLQDFHVVHKRGT